MLATCSNRLRSWPGFSSLAHLRSREVLIVADEFPAMEWLAGTLKAQEGLASRVVARPTSRRSCPGSCRDRVPPRQPGRADRAGAHRLHARGGKLVVLHHSISSGKRKNAQWFKFLGVALPEGDVSQGGYKWIEPVTSTS